MRPALRRTIPLACAALILTGSGLARASEPAPEQPGASEQPAQPIQPPAPAAQPPAPAAQPPAAPERPKAPQDGHGMLAVGSMALAAGAGAFAGTAYLAVDGYDAEVWSGTLVLGLLATGTGGLFVGLGHRRRVAFQSWAANQPGEVPSSGSGMIGSGAGLVIVGASLGLSGTIAWAVSNVGFQDPMAGAGPSPVPPILVGVGVGSLAAGTALLVVGMKRRHRFADWRASRGLARVQLQPTFAFGPGGGQIGVAGRF